MYYVPSKYKGSYNFIFSHDGKVMDPNSIMAKHKYVVPNESFFDKLPEAIQKGLIQHRKGSLNNTNFTWTGYRDCPFVNKHHVDEYKLISGSGWYSKMYQIMFCVQRDNILNSHTTCPKSKNGPQNCLNGFED